MVFGIRTAIKTMRTGGGACGWGGIILLAASWLGCGGSSKAPAAVSRFQPEKPHLQVGLSVPTSTYLPVYLAQDEGLFSREGLEVDLVSFRGGMDLIKAVVAGSIDIGVVSLVEVTAGIEAGQALKVFYAGFNIPEFDWYAVRPIRSLADAKGKRFGISQYGTSTDFLTRYALLVSGIDPKSVQIVQGGDSATRLAAMQVGQLDVNVFAAPEKFIAAERNYNLILRQRDLIPDYPYHVFVATEAAIANLPNTLKSFLRGHVRGVRLAKQDKERAKQTLIRNLHINPKYAGPTYDDFIDYIYEDGRLPSDPALAMFFDMGMKAGRYKERWPRDKYFSTAYVGTFNEWQPEPPAK